MSLRIHAIVLALNEQAFIDNQLRTLYPFCSGISVLTQYDRDWYGKPMAPDRTAELVLGFPDPAGKIHFVVRRSPDEAAARNQEMLSLTSRPHSGVMSHGSESARISGFYDRPDYFFIVDADELYDPETLPGMIALLAAKRPRGMRVNAFNYVRTWNRRVPADVVRFCHFGFVQPGVLFTMRRTVSWNESRLAKLLHLMRMPDFSARLWGFIECPWSVGFFHHGCWLGKRERLISKSLRSSHQEIATVEYPDEVAATPFVFVPDEQLPLSIRNGSWPAEFFDRSASECETT
jgi:hypothetical protein